MLNNIKENRKAIGLIEIVIAIVIFVSASIPILKMLTSSRTETSSSINYLRAVELADEAIEWASIAGYSNLDQLESLSGPVGDESSSLSDFTADSENEDWKKSTLFKKDIGYPKQYSNAFFYRDIVVEDVEDNNMINMMRKVIVTVSWAEGRRPTNLNTSEGRNKKVVLGVLIVNDDNLNF